MFTGDGFIQLSGKLVVLAGGDEASFRTAVSRAYYGAFHLARAYLDELGFPVPKNLNAHGYLQQQFLNSGHSEAKTAGQVLRTLHRNRIVADYRAEDERLTTPDFARRNVELAHEFQSLLNACDEETQRTEIRTGIANYRAKFSGDDLPSGN